MTRDEKVALHNKVVRRQTRRTFAAFNPKAPGVLTRAPKGYSFDIRNLLFKTD